MPKFRGPRFFAGSGFPDSFQDPLLHSAPLRLTEVARRGAIAKMSPPLRGVDDVAAMVRGLADGTIDTIATDHAPHTSTEKQLPFEEAPMGIVGLETAVGLTMTHLVHTGKVMQQHARPTTRTIGQTDDLFQSGAGSGVYVEVVAEQPIDSARDRIVDRVGNTPPRRR